MTAGHHDLDDLDENDQRHELYLVRHGATEWSRDGRHTGTTDLALLPEGIEQAKATDALLDRRPFALVLTSPLQRARRTCELAGYAEHAEVAPDLSERDYGMYEGVTTKQIRATVPDWTVWDGAIPGGETIQQVAARADRVITRVRAVAGEVALFGHGHMLRVLAARWCDLDPRAGRHLPLDTATLSILGWEHEWGAIRVWNKR